MTVERTKLHLFSFALFLLLPVLCRDLVLDVTYCMIYDSHLLSMRVQLPLQHIALNIGAAVAVLSWDVKFHPAPCLWVVWWTDFKAVDNKEHEKKRIKEKKLERREVGRSTRSDFKEAKRIKYGLGRLFSSPGSLCILIHSSLLSTVVLYRLRMLLSWVPV